MGGRLAGLIRRLGRRLAFLLTIDVRLLVAVVAVASFGLGYFGLWQYLHHLHKPAPPAYGDSWDDVLFYDLQLYTFAAAPAADPGPFPVWLEIARFLAPLGLLLAVLAALRLVLADQIRRYLAGHASGHAIVTGDGAVALTLARNLGKGTGGRKGEGRKVVLVGTSDDTLTQARRYDILTVRGQPSDRATLSAAGVARADQIYACASASHGSLNVDSAVLADQLTEGRERPLLAYALVPGATLDGDLRALRVGASGETGQRLDFFTLEDCAARKLITDYPLTGDAGHPPQAVIIGFGPLGQAVLREIARGQLARHGGPRVEVFVRNATEPQVAAAIAAFPPIGYACTVRWGQTLELPGAGAYTVFVCLDDDDKALSESMAAGSAVASGRGYVVACVRESASFARTLAGYTRILEDLRGKIRVFGIIEEACVPANVRDDAFIEQLARAIHQDYVAKNQGAPSAVPWDDLSGDLRQANVAQAVGIGAKLAVINAVVAPESTTAPKFSFAETEVEELAKLEHERWMRERKASGWKYGAKRNNRRKIHPDLVDWDALPEDEKNKDSDAVRAIPGILSKVGYQILRLPPNS
jgi:hypothetical protein